LLGQFAVASGLATGICVRHHAQLEGAAARGPGQARGAFGLLQLRQHLGQPVAQAGVVALPFGGGEALPSSSSRAASLSPKSGRERLRIGRQQHPAERAGRWHSAGSWRPRAALRRAQRWRPRVERAGAG
jgi:hypothetical protein